MNYFVLLVTVVGLPVLFFLSNSLLEKKLGKGIPDVENYAKRMFEMISEQCLSLFGLAAIYLLQMYLVTNYLKQTGLAVGFALFILAAIYLSLWTYFVSLDEHRIEIRRMLSYLAIGVITSATYFNQFRDWAMIHHLQGAPQTGIGQWFGFTNGAIFLALDRVFKLFIDDWRKHKARMAVKREEERKVSAQIGEQEEVTVTE